MLYYENIFNNKVKFKSQSNWIQSDHKSLILFKELLRTVQTRYHKRRTTN